MAAVGATTEQGTRQMTQPPESDDPYLQRPPGQARPDEQRSGEQRSGEQRSGEHPGYPQQPGYQPQGYQPQGYQPTGYPQGAGGQQPVEVVRAQRPPSVVRLVQVMLVGAVASVLIGVNGLLSLDTLLADVTADLDQVAADSGIDSAQLNDIVSSTTAGAVVVGMVLSAGLWLLFAWLFRQGSARVLGTVLGGINAVGAVFAVIAPTSLTDLLLQLLHLAAIVAAFVLLWRPATSAWFGAVRTAKQPAGWS